MSGECDKCGVHCLECRCQNVRQGPVFPEEKQAEVTFKYHARDNKYDIWLHINAWKFKCALGAIDDVCRSLLKWPPAGYSEETYERLFYFAERIREMVPNMDCDI